MYIPTDQKQPGPESAEGSAVAARVRLMRDGLLNYAGFLVSGLVGIVMVPVMMHALGNELYGVWIAMLSMIALGSIVDLGLGWTITREVAAGTGERSSESAHLVRAARDGFILVGAGGALVVGLLGVAAARTEHFSPATAQVLAEVFCLGGVIFFAGQMTEFARSLLRGLRRFDLVSLLAAGFAVAWALGVITVIACGGKLLAVATVYAVVAIATAVGAAKLGSAAFPEIGERYQRGEFSVLRGRFSFGVASQAVAILTTVLWEVAPLVIGWMLGPRAIVPYHVGRKFPLAAALIGWSAAGALFPAASESAHHRGSARARETFEVGTRWILAMVAPLCVMFWILAPNLLHAWLGSASPEMVAVMRVMSAVVMADALGEAGLYFLWGCGEVFPVLAVAACELAAHLVLLVWMLGHFGPVGAAWALLIPKIFGSLALVVLTSRWCAIGHREFARNTLAGLLAPLGALVLVLWFGVSIMNPAGWPGVIAVSTLAAAIYGAVFYRTGARLEERTLIRQALAIPLAGAGVLAMTMLSLRQRDGSRVGRRRAM
jgi:O-antigen/teichoic acid export membrane protein